MSSRMVDFVSGRFWVTVVFVAYGFFDFFSVLCWVFPERSSFGFIGEVAVVVFYGIGDVGWEDVVFRFFDDRFSFFFWLFL